MQRFFFDFCVTIIIISTLVFQVTRPVVRPSLPVIHATVRDVWVGWFISVLVGSWSFLSTLNVGAVGGNGQ
jgi:hypothetical protein